MVTFGSLSLQEIVISVRHNEWTASTTKNLQPFQKTGFVKYVQK